MDTDRPIKFLFERQAQSLLPFIGETNSRVTTAESIALPVANRAIDCVLRLERDGAVWYRHLEFQSESDPEMAWRCFEYNSRLILHYRAPVFTTVLYLLPVADEGAQQDALRLYLRDRLAYEWRYDVVRLSEIPVDLAFECGETGPLALVPLLRGGDAPEKILEAMRKLEALPRPQSADALSILLDLASQRYNPKTLMSMLGKERVMESYLWQMGLDTGEIKGLAEGKVRAAREICADLAKSLHPSVAKRVLPVIQACKRPKTLRAWIMACPTLSDAAFAALVTGKPSSSQRSPTSRPSRRSVAVRKAR